MLEGLRASLHPPSTLFILQGSDEGLPVRLDADVPEGPGREVVSRVDSHITEVPALVAPPLVPLRPQLALRVPQVAHRLFVLLPQRGELPPEVLLQRFTGSGPQSGT